VGNYPHSDFIHVDAGGFPQWCFECPAGLPAINGD